MKLSSLNSLLVNELSPTEFSTEISEELIEHTQGLEKISGVASVRVTEDLDILITRKNLNILCNLFITDSLTSSELAYVADAMQMSDRVEFSDSGISDIVSEFTDPIINGVFTKERALIIMGNHVA